MPPATRTARALAAFAALAGLVLGLVVCGAATPPAAPGPAVAGAVTPGCGQGDPAGEGAAGPVVPPRAQGFGELLPALLEARDGCAGLAADEGPAEATRGREPPALVPPSPVELSILRV